MRMSKLYLPTLKETPKEAEIISHKLMLRAGMMRGLTAGVYTLLPLGFKVLKKIEKIVERIMDESGAQEILMPGIHPAELWKESGRWDKFGPLMIKFFDRKEREYCLGPTHEEIIIDLIKNEVRSYKDLPLNLYQIQTKVRDEIRPRFGVMRGREFIMKDAYSLDIDYDGLDKSYQIMYDAYTKIFKELGLDVRVVEADSGAMGGKDSHEFMVIAESGEDQIAFCKKCNYASNVERASAMEEKACKDEDMKEIVYINTPDIKTIDALVKFLNIESDRLIKTIALLADGEPVLVLVRGDDTLNEVKLKNYLDVFELKPVEELDFNKFFNSIPGFIGPVGIENVRIIADLKVKNMINAITGANKKDYHIKNVNPERDFKVETYIDLRKIKSGDLCPVCSGEIEIKSGIEVGHIFKLGTKYSESMGATYLDDSGKEKPIVMGSYGIGITRLIAAAIEQSHDENGIIWPKEIAPYQVIILPLGDDNEVLLKSEELYNTFSNEGIEVLLDDRNERAGVKFNDAELIGIPIRLTIGIKSLERGLVEVRVRESGKDFEFNLADAVSSTKILLGRI